MKFKEIFIYLIMAVVGLCSIYCLFSIFCSNDVNQKNIFVSLFMVSITFMGILFNVLHNISLIDENLNTRYLQIMYKDSKSAINHLKIDLQITIDLYRFLKTSLDYNDCEIDILSPHAFLVMQFINIISDCKLLDDLPILIRGNLEKKFSQELLLEPEYGPSSKYLKIMENTPSRGYDELPFHYYIEYKSFVDKFMNSNYLIQSKYLFSCYFESKNISEERLFNHYNEILNDLINNRIDELILRERDIKIEQINYKDVIIDNNSASDD